MSQHDAAAFDLVDRFSKMCDRPDTVIGQSELVRLTGIEKVLASIRDDYDREIIKYSDIKDMLCRADKCDDFIARYNMEVDADLGMQERVGRELRKAVDEFATVCGFDSDDNEDGEEMQEVGGDGKAPAKLSALCEGFLKFVRGKMKRYDEESLRAAFAVPTAGTEEEPRIDDLVVTSAKAGVLAKHVAAHGGQERPVKGQDWMKDKMEMVQMVSQYAQHAKKYIGSAGGHGALPTTRRPATPPAKRAHKCLNFSADTEGYLNYVRLEHEDIQLPLKRLFPPWATLCSMFAQASDDDAVDALCQTGFDMLEPDARKAVACFRTFYREHHKAARVNGGGDYGGHGSYPSSSRGGGDRTPTPPPKKNSDDDESDTERETGGWLGREEQMRNYLKGHPEAVDNPKRNKNLDFYRGAKAMQPYNCFIHEFHRRPDAVSDDDDDEEEVDVKGQDAEEDNGVSAQAGDNEDSSKRSQHDDPNANKSKPHPGSMAARMGSTSTSTSTSSGGAAMRKKNPSHSKAAHWFGNYARLEIEHSYIQWLFPIQEGGGMSSTSQRLHKHELVLFRKDRAVQERFIRSYETMLDFWGMVLLDRTSGKIGRKKDYVDRYKNLNTSSHNYLRITRVLKCLGEIGYEHYKAPWVEFFLREMYEHQELTNCCSSCKDYWMQTMRNEEDTKYLADLQEELEQEHGVIKPSWGYPSYSGGGSSLANWWDDTPVGGGSANDPDFDESAAAPPETDATTGGGGGGGKMTAEDALKWVQGGGY